MITTEHPGQVCPAGECDGSGAVWVDECTCGTGPAGYHGAHEPGCGAEPCPAECWNVDADEPCPECGRGDCTEDNCEWPAGGAGNPT